jgi:hypothetical protein
VCSRAGLEVLEKRKISWQCRGKKPPAPRLVTILTELSVLPPSRSTVPEIYCTACNGSTVTSADGSLEFNTADALTVTDPRTYIGTY